MATQQIHSINLSRRMVDTSSPEAEAESHKKIQHLDKLYTELTQAIRLANQDARLSVIAQQQADISAKQITMKQAEFLHYCGVHVKEVADWGYWPVKPIKEGEDIILVTPLSEKEVMASVKVQHSQVVSEQQRVLGNNTDYSSMFGTEDPEQ